MVVSYWWPWWWSWGTTVVYYREYEPYDEGTTIVYNYYNYDEEDNAPVPADEAPPPEKTTTVSAQQAAPAGAASTDQEAFLQSLNPAELSFLTGLVSFRGGQYEQAAEAWYTATLKSPEAVPPRAFLVIGLFAIGEYQRAAQYLTDIVKKNPDFARYVWDLKRLYGRSRAAELESHLATLQSYIDLYPNRIEGHLVKGFVLFAAQRWDEAREAFGKAATLEPENPVVKAFSAVLKEREAGKPSAVVFDEFQTFLRTLRLEDVKRLGL